MATPSKSQIDALKQLPAPPDAIDGRTRAALLRREWACVDAKSGQLWRTPQGSYLLAAHRRDHPDPAQIVRLVVIDADAQSLMLFKGQIVASGPITGETHARILNQYPESEIIVVNQWVGPKPARKDV
jgi:hypothetical protein